MNPPHSAHPPVRPDAERVPPTAADADLGFALPEPARPSGARLTGLLVLALAAVAAAFFIGYMPRREQSAALSQTTLSANDSSQLVDVVQPKIKASKRPVVLTATLQPLEETVLYPRASGYVAQWHVDIGERVKAGQLLAEIESPELDQQLDQARAELLRRDAALGQAKTQEEYAKTSLARYERLRPAGVASQQEIDQKTAEAHVAEANTAAAAANIEVGRADFRRLTQLKSFCKVTAPFAGMITQRSVERGALVATGTPLYRVQNNDVLRAFLQVPQDLAVHVKLGSTAQINLREYPEKSFVGTLSRVAGALEPSTRTMTTEIRIDNQEHTLLSGMYVQASLAIEQAHNVFELPATVLWNDAQGLRVAVVDAEDKLHFRSVGLERDAGATLQIASGLRGDERVVKLASAALREGDKVRIRPAAPAAQP